MSRNGWLSGGPDVHYGVAEATSVRDEITTTRVRDDIVTEMTNIETKSDAWGKVIPMGFGRHRVAGALVWASQFYKTTETYTDVTTKKNIVHWRDNQMTTSFPPGGNIVNKTVTTEFDVVRSSGSQITTGTFEDAYIDLCYSFGTEGDVRRKRFIEKVRINDTVVYDTSKGFVADGIGFSIRYGYDNAPPALLEKYPNGKFHYKGQTLICFEKFPLELFGNSIPNSVDVEWGCCGFETGGNMCQLQAAYTLYGDDPISVGGGATPYQFKAGDLLLLIASDAGNVNFSKFTSSVSSSFGGKSYKVGLWALSSNDAASLNSSGYTLSTGKARLILRVHNTNTGLPILESMVRQLEWRQVSAGATYTPSESGSLGYGVCFAFSPDASYQDFSGFVSNGEGIGGGIGGIENVPAPGGGWNIFSCVIASPCLQVG
jgi:hypothetical protein